MHLAPKFMQRVARPPDAASTPTAAAAAAIISSLTIYRQARRRAMPLDLLMRAETRARVAFVAPRARALEACHTTGLAHAR
jgi:hypothetical protein